MFNLRNSSPALLLLSSLTLGCGGGDQASHDESDHHADRAEGAGGEGHHAEGHHAEGEAEEHAEASDAPEPARVLEDGSRLFGSELDEARELTALGDVLAEPARFEGQVVKTSGEIVQVCQSMGCWMEMRADADSPGIRVPMAGHSFFLPRDLAGSQATVEGTVNVTPLSDEDREHLESEGATAAGQAISIEATGVLVAAAE